MISLIMYIGGNSMMIMARIILVLLASFMVISCSPITNQNSNNDEVIDVPAIDMDSDYSIEQGMIGTWVSTDGKYRLICTTGSRATWYTDNEIIWDGTYAVVDRSLTIKVPPYVGPVFKVNSISVESMSITGTGRYYFTNQVLSFVRQ